MAQSLNSYNGSGYVATEIKTAQMPSGGYVANFSVPINNPKEDETFWANCVYYYSEGKGDKVLEYLNKGTFVMISGSLRTRKYADKGTGETKYSTEVVLNKLVLGPRTENSGSAGNAAAGGETEDFFGLEPSEIPF